MMRTFLLWLSEQQGVFNFLRRNSLARKFASRFVAGETRETATSAALELKHLGIGTTLDLLGESVNRPADAVAARDEYLRMLDGLAASGADINVSVKLTQMGFDIDEAVCLDNMRRILAKARDLGGFVRLDMESSAYTQRTLDFFERHLLAEFGKHTGVVIQSCLRRSAADVQRLIEIGARVRLCKGAYLESPDVAFPDKKDVDRQFIALMEALLRHGHYPGIATHDNRMIEHARAFVTRECIPAERFEFQMLYGVRRDLQERLRKDGFNMRVYIPFGTQWYPYLMRRLAERPANIVFIFGNVVRETLALKP
jgi:proline dehydrogenase